MPPKRPATSTARSRKQPTSDSTAPSTNVVESTVKSEDPLPATAAAAGSSSTNPNNTDASLQTTTSKDAQRKLEEQAFDLYAACEEHSTPYEQMWDTHELWQQAQEMKLINSIIELVPLTEYLVRHKYLRTVRVGHQDCFQLRTRPAAKRLLARLQKGGGGPSGAAAEDVAVYESIEAAGRNGKWLRSIKNDVGLAQFRVDAAIKRLMKDKFVKKMSSVKFPSRKSFILYHLDPLEEVTGGEFYADGELDEEFVEHIGEIVCGRIESLSWRRGSRVPTERRHDRDSLRRLVKAAHGDLGPNMGTDHIPGRPDTDSTGELRFPPMTDSKGRYYLIPHPAGYDDYPTASEVLLWIDGTGLIKNKDLSREDISALLEMLVFDGRLERVGEKSVKLDLDEGMTLKADDIPRDSSEIPPQPSSSASSSKKRKSSPITQQSQAPAPQTANSDDSEEEKSNLKPPPPKRVALSSPAQTQTQNQSQTPASDYVQLTPEQRSRTVMETQYRTALRQPRGNLGPPPPPVTAAGGGGVVSVGPTDAEPILGAGASAISDVPCGRCPAFSECEVDPKTVVNVETCKYLPKWLEI